MVPHLAHFKPCTKSHVQKIIIKEFLLNKADPDFPNKVRVEQAGRKLDNTVRKVYGKYEVLYFSSAMAS